MNATRAEPKRRSTNPVSAPLSILSARHRKNDQSAGSPNFTDGARDVSARSASTSTMRIESLTRTSFRGRCGPGRPTLRPLGGDFTARTTCRFLGLLLALVTLMILCSCATQYRPARSGKGYSDWQISSNEFAVSFRGNGGTDISRASDFALLRSAQVALEHGFTHFAVMDVTNTSSARSYTVHQQFYAPVPPERALSPMGIQQPWPYGQGYLVQYDEPHIYFRPGTVLRIKCFVSKPEKPFTYDAKALQQSLKLKYKLH